MRLFVGVFDNTPEKDEYIVVFDRLGDIDEHCF